MAKNTNALVEKFLKNTKLKHTRGLNTSILTDPLDDIETDVPGLNIALSGRLDGGLSQGLTQIVGPSKHFKTSFGLVMVAAFLKKYDDAVVLFFDCEFGASMEYFEKYGITEELRERIIHIPFENLEQLKFELMGQLDEISRGEHVMVFIDSVGLAASKKEVEDAIAEKSSADMTRAKAVTSLARMITPILNIKKIPCVMINHSYKTQEMFAKDIVGGGQKIELSSASILMISRSKEKDSDNVVTGYTFNIKIMKSRRVVEESKLPIDVSWEDGIHKWSGLSEIAAELGVIEQTKIKNSKAYRYVTKAGKEFIIKADDIDRHDEFWTSVIKETNFADLVEQTYSTAGKAVEEIK